jgi:2'-5' RNA ligase
VSRFRDPRRLPVDWDRPRLFFAIPLSAEARNAIAGLAERVRLSVDGVRARWVRFEGLHLTLQFLGATPDEAVPELREALVDVAAGRPPFEIGLGGAGAFPSPGRPRTLWVAVTAGGDAVTQLALAVAADPRVAPHVPARPDNPDGAAERFAPHLTIARTDGVSGAPRLAAALLAEAAELDVRFAADRLVLYRSVLGEGRARYEPLAEAQLGG